MDIETLTEREIVAFFVGIGVMWLLQMVLNLLRMAIRSFFR